MQTFIISRPDDWHVHFRDGLLLNDTVNATATHFGRALVMPNLSPALTRLQDILAYRERILKSLIPENPFEPMMTFYLNEKVLLEDFQSSLQYPFILGAKLYPAQATTNSEEGVRSIEALYPWFDWMQENGRVLQVHGEENAGDIFEREALFIDNQLTKLIKNFPKLKIVLEHISTKKAVDFVLDAKPNLAATVTPQHLYYNRNDLLAGGIKPHFYCLPVLKKQSDQQAIQQVVLSGNPKFFAGTDSAPHIKIQKESACGCAGIYSAPFALSLYTQFFDEAASLDKLEAFLAHHGADFYQLPRSKEQIILQKVGVKVPDKMTLGTDWVVPMAADRTLCWSVMDG